MSLREADAGAKRIDPAIHKHGWQEVLMKSIEASERKVAEALERLRKVGVRR